MGGRFAVGISTLVMLLAPASVLAQADELDAPMAPEVDTVFEPPSPASDLSVPTGYTEGRSRLGSQTAFVPPGAVVRTPGRPIDDEGHSRFPRIMMLGLAGGATMAAAGFGMFELGCATQGGGKEDSSCYAVGWPLGIASALSLTPLSVWLTGKLMDGNGGYGWTLLGTGIGTAAGALGALGMVASGVIGDATFVPLMIGPVLGSILLYELSSDASQSAVEEAERRARASFTATLAPTDGGGMVGVAGTF
jgi:hypothetical protein